MKVPPPSLKKAKEPLRRCSGFFVESKLSEYFPVREIEVNGSMYPYFVMLREEDI